MNVFEFIKGMFKLKQYNIDNGKLGGFLQIFQQGMFVLGFFTFFNTTLVAYDLKYKYFIPSLPLFFVGVTAGYILWCLFYFSIIYPSLVTFSNRQSYTHKHPIKDEFELVNSKLDEITNLKNQIKEMQMLNVSITPSELSDCKLFYDARYNDFANKYSPKPQVKPALEEHSKWFETHYNKNCYTIKYNNIGIGYVRINDDNYVSISIMPKYHNKGIGTEVLKQITSMYDNLKAEVHPDNLISMKFFSKFPEIEVKIM